MRISMKVTRLVAEKIYANLSKGMPPLKPDHGEHGGCSWALHSGNAYVGRLVDRNVDVMVEIPDTLVDTSEYPDHRIKRSKAGIDCLLLNKLTFVTRDHPDLTPSQLHAKTWDAVGDHIRGSRKAMLLFVPSCEMSRNKGYFVVIPPVVGPSVTMSDDDEDALLQQILRWNPQFTQNLDAAALQKEQQRGKALVVKLSATSQQALASSVQAMQEMALPQPVSQARDPLQEVAPKLTGGSWVSGKALPGSGGVSQRSVLTYATYREARMAFKHLRAIELGVVAGPRLVVEAPADWPDKLKMLYSQRV